MTKAKIPNTIIYSLNPKQVQEFQKLYFEKYNVKLDDTTAYSYAQNLLWLVHFMAK